MNKLALVGKNLNLLGKRVDQPITLAKFSSAVPTLLVGGATLWGAKNVYGQPKEERKKSIVKNASVLSFTVLAALASVRGMPAIKLNGKTLFKGFEGLIESRKVADVAKEQHQLVSDFLKNHSGSLSGDAKSLLKKAASNFKKENALNFSEVKSLHEHLGSTEAGKKFLKELIPEPVAVGHMDILNEIKRLSILGLVPVVGGVAGGIVGDKLNKDKCAAKLPDKIKEGFYQYFANIFLCNVGAGLSLFALDRLEKSKIIKTPSAVVRAGAMVTGILTTGVIGGSSIANFMSKKLIDPLFNKDSGDKKKGLYDERRPECLDVALHADDIATIGVLSGFKWIEPSLPLMYAVSGYRAGMGYRNGKKSEYKKINDNLPVKESNVNVNIGYLDKKKSEENEINDKFITKESNLNSNADYLDKCTDNNVFAKFKNSMV